MRVYPAVVIAAFVDCGRVGFLPVTNASEDALATGSGGDAMRRTGGGDATNGDAAAGGDASLPPRLVFITASGPNGGIGGLSGANSMCQSEAASGGKAGTFVAVLGAVGSNPVTRIALNQGRTIVTPNGVEVATDSTFWQATHLSALDIDVSGATVTGVFYSWTDFTPGGIALSGDDCSGWTNTQGTGSAGRGLINYTDSNWAQNDLGKCNSTNHLICIEQ